MRKLIICGTVAAMLMSSASAVFANTNVASNVVGDDAKIQITSDKKDGLYTVYFLKPGETAASIIDNSTAFAGVEQFTLDFTDGKDYGTREISFKLPGLTGTYTAVIGGGELSGKEVKLPHTYSVSTRENIAALKAASTLDEIESILTKPECNGTHWYADTDNKTYKANKTAVLTAFKELLKDANDISGVTTAFNKACMIGELNICNKNEVYDALFLAEPVLGITYGEYVYQKPEALSSAFTNLRATEKFATASELQDFLKKAEALAKLNTATRDTVISVIEGYNTDVFKLDLTGSYVGIDKYSLAKKLVVTNGETYDSMAEVKERFNNAIAAVLAENTGGNNGGLGFGGGGGGSSVGGSYPTKNPEVVSDDLKNNDTDGFSDLDGAEWAKPYIVYLSEKNIMTGDGNGKFRPNDKVMREEFLKTVIEALGLAGDEDLTEAKKFGDVDADAWYAKYIAAGLRLGIVTGKSENSFGINDEITRQDAAVMIKRAVDAAELGLYADKTATVFTDADSISDYAKDAVEALQRAGIINGYETGEFAPQNSILRSETAKMIYTMLSGINK